MRILKYSEFLKLPSNTVYAKYYPYSHELLFGALCIKGDSTDYDEHYRTSLIDINASGSDDLADKLELAEASSDYVLELDTESTERNGFREYEDLYLVLDSNEVQKIINKLKTTLN